MAALTEKELKQQKKRFAELANKSYLQNIFTFTGFLSLAEQETLHEAMEEAGFAAYSLWGGADGCERQMARFGSPEELGYEAPFPVAALRISPLQEKFADTLTHRDFLGALMNLGIDRSTMGDIFLEGKGAWLYCTETIAPYICEQLGKVRHTTVRCQQAEPGNLPAVREPEPEHLIVSALRVDAVAAKVFSLSRSQSLELFRAGKVFVNGRLCENNSAQLGEGDLVSVRGYGRFIFKEAGGNTRKGKLNITVGVYR